MLSPTKLGENAGSLFARRSADHSARYAAIGPLESTVPKIKVEITGADDPTRVAIQSAIVRALEPFTRGSVNASYEIASEIVD